MNGNRFLNYLVVERLGIPFSSKFLLATKIFLVLLAFILTSSACFAKKVNITQTRYDIEGVETGTQGTCLVKVYIYTKKGEAPSELIKYAAVHGVLFRGFSGKGFGTQKSLARPEIEKQKSEFFSAFWNNGDYLAFATIVNAVADRIKVSKKEYKIGAVVSVSKDALRKTMEEAGIISGLNSRF